MAQLKDTLIQGSARVTDTLYVNKVDTSTLNANNLETNLLKINTSGTDASSTTVGINLTNGNTINAHIGTSDSLGLYAANNIFMRPGGASGNSTEGMVLSTGALNPKDNALTLGNASHRWKSLYTAGYTYIYGNNQWCLDVFIYNKSKTQVGEIYYNSGNADNVTTGQYSFRQWSPKSTADTGTSGFHETFSLPAVTVGRTANAGYTIITTKNLSSITSLGTLASDLNFKAGTSDDSPDIVWWYGNNKEQARIWMGSGGTTKFAPNYRCYDSAGNSLYSGKLVIGDGTGASGTWAIDISGNAATATKATQDGSDNTITNKYFQIYNTSYQGNSSAVTVNDLATQGPAYGMINHATDNPIGSATWVHVLNMGWSKANTSWIGQIALHTNGTTMYFRGNGSSAIAGKAWNTVLSSNNYSSYALPLSGGTMTGTITLANTGLKTPSAAGFTTDQYGNFKHQSTSTSNTWQLLTNAGAAKFLYTWETGDLSISGGLTATNGFTGNLTGNATSATRIKTTTVTTNDNNNATGYFLVYTWTIGTWSNYRMAFMVRSRHNGNGLIDIAVGNNSSTIDIDNMYAQIMYWGNTSAGAIITADSWVIHGSSDGTKAYLFAKYNDYNESIITPLTDTWPEKSTWMTSINVDTYGEQKAFTQINVAVSAHSATNATTASKLTNFKVTTTTNLGIDAPGTNAIGYVSGLTKANWNYQQTDGSLYTQFYNTSWISEIFQDYRTGQLSVRGKNNGTWQSWRRILDETNGATILGLSNYRLNTQPHSGAWFTGTPIVGSDGVTEIGKYIDFHSTNAGTSDYDARITASTSGLTLSGTTTGTFSGNLTGNVTGTVSGNAGSATKLANARTLWGQSFNGTANVTGNMTSVGPNMMLPSGQTAFCFFTSGSGAANAHFGRLGLNSTYANIDITNYVLDANGASRFGGKVTVNHATPTYAFSISNSEKASIEYNSTNHVLNFIVT